jgi:biotin carboxylase
MSVAGRTVLLVGAGYPGKRRIIERIAELGVRQVIVETPGHWSAALVEEGLADTFLAVAHDEDPEREAQAILKAVRAAGIEPDGALTFFEPSVPAAARVAAALGLPGNPVDAVDDARSKARMRERSVRLGLPTPRAARVRSLDELFAAADIVGFPAVVKPEFGAGQVGCIRVDDVGTLPEVYRLAAGELDQWRGDEDWRGQVVRAGSDLLLEQYLPGVEFDVDLVLHEGEIVFHSVSQNWPTAEPSFQETGLHCPPDHRARDVRALVELCTSLALGFGFRRGVLHIEGKCTPDGPRIIELNARMGGGRIYEMVRAVWGVDLIEAHVSALLGEPPSLTPSRKPRCTVVNEIVFAPATGRLTDLNFGDLREAREHGLGVLDVSAEVGQQVNGPEHVFATALADLYVSGRNLKHARHLAADILHDPPRVEPA